MKNVTHDQTNKSTCLCVSKQGHTDMKKPQKLNNRLKDSYRSFQIPNPNVDIIDGVLNSRKQVGCRDVAYGTVNAIRKITTAIKIT